MPKLKAFFFILIFSLTTMDLFAQVDTAWVRRYNGPGNLDDRISALTADASGNVYVTGRSFGGTSYDFATIKYASNGDTLWVRRYSNGVASAIALDRSSNVYVTGYSYDSGLSSDYITIKYSPNGETQWVRRYNGSNGSDEACALAVDDSGNVYVTGSSHGSGTFWDYATIKYSPNGETLWVRRYNGPGNWWDQATTLTVDKNANVYVTGWSDGIGSGYSGFDYATIKYTPKGDELWVKRYNGPGNTVDEGHSLAVDNDGNIYVTGMSGSLTSFDYTTIRYTPDGDSLWVKRYDGPMNYLDVANDLAVDKIGNVYVTGFSYIRRAEPEYDYATLKYAINGDTLWVRRYNGTMNLYDIAYALVVDEGGNVYVTGASYGRGTGEDFATIKYSPDGEVLWVGRYNSLGGLSDRAYAMAVDKNGNVYVAGEGYSDGTNNYDFLTIKYIPIECSAIPGDVTVDGMVSMSDLIFILNHVFKHQSTPNPICRGDVTADGVISPSDLIYLINFLFKHGPSPLKSGACCL